VSTKRSNQPRRRSPRTADERGPARRPIKVTPRRKTEIDPHLVALVYYLIASRLVRDAQADERGPATDAQASSEPQPSSTAEEAA